MMGVVDFQKHGETAKGDLLGQFKGKANVEGLLDAVAPQLNELDAAFVDLVLERTLDTAIGAQLDQLASVANTERGSSTDAELRARIKAEIRLNRSEGTIEDVLEVLVLILGISATIGIADFPPASFVVTVEQIASSLAGVLADLVARTRPAAVNGQLVYSEGASSAVFTFSSGDTEESSTTQGWAPDDQSTGGAFADAVEA